MRGLLLGVALAAGSCATSPVRQCEGGFCVQKLPQKILICNLREADGPSQTMAISDADGDRKVYLFCTAEITKE